jgi:uncharacterized protein (DUF2236 family)
MELGTPVKLTIPSRWVVINRDHQAAQAELSQIAIILVRSAEAIGDLYMRMCDLIRESDITDDEVRHILESHFPPSRISEILRVSRAPREVYIRYTAGFFGFKAALRQCRGYQVTAAKELCRRKIRRAAERLVLLLGGPAELHVRGHVVKVD